MTSVKNELRPYQEEIGRAILDSVDKRKGLTFSVMIARQGGKNEISAQVEATVLTAWAKVGGSAVKAAPTFSPQARISISRLKDLLDGAGGPSSYEFDLGYIFRLGRARQIFLSAHPASNVVGATADLLLEVDESQDVSPEKYNREFRPMGASSNVTTVHYGTAWDDSGLLEQVKQSNLELERKDQVRRHFEYDWNAVAEFNPDYGRYVESERERLGNEHPLFQSQYCLVPVTGDGTFLNGTQQALLRGSHDRLRAPRPKAVYLVGVDLSGEAEEADDARLRALKPKQDSTVVTIGELEEVGKGKDPKLPSVRVVEHYWWTGRPHTEVYSNLVQILKELWGCRRVVVDATGIGAGVAAFLEKAMGRSVVTPFLFTSKSKSELGFDLLAAVNSGRLRMYKADGSPEYREFWSQIAKARSTFRPNQTMNFYVDPARGHDDFLSSLALLVSASDYLPRRASGRLREGFE